jgi:predicted aspartyl protease
MSRVAFLIVFAICSGCSKSNVPTSQSFLRPSGGRRSIENQPETISESFPSIQTKSKLADQNVLAHPEHPPSSVAGDTTAQVEEPFEPVANPKTGSHQTNAIENRENRPNANGMQGADQLGRRDTPNLALDAQASKTLKRRGSQKVYSAAVTASEFLEKVYKEFDYERVKLNRTHVGYLCVRVSVQGKELDLILDTGSPNTCLDREIVSSLKLFWKSVPKSYLIGPSDFDSSAVSQVEHMQIGTFVANNVRLGAYKASVSNEWLSSFGDPPIAGLLGADVLSRYSAIIDYESSSLYLSDEYLKKKNSVSEWRAWANVSIDDPNPKLGSEEQGAKPKMLEAKFTTGNQAPSLSDVLKQACDNPGYQNVQIDRLHAGYLGIRAFAQGKQLHLLMDTGAPMTYLDRDRTRSFTLDWNPCIQLYPPRIWCARLVGHLDELQIGAFSMRQARIDEFDMSLGNTWLAASKVPPADGLLGANLLSEYCAIIDYAFSTLYLKKKK